MATVSAVASGVLMGLEVLKGIRPVTNVRRVIDAIDPTYRVKVRTKKPKFAQWTDSLEAMGYGKRRRVRNPRRVVGGRKRRTRRS